eukprot:m.101357 g.101357  ORF g.101357 m.101357 type:complete len:436 (-) comp27326_c1_seq2:120-1427(-)
MAMHRMNRWRIQLPRCIHIVIAWIILLAGVLCAEDEACGLNGIFKGATCTCDQGWTGNQCSMLDLAPASVSAFGVYDELNPTWGGGAVFEGGNWHMLVGSRALANTNDTITDYPCDSKIVRAVSQGKDPTGPYQIEETLVERSSWEPGIARGPRGELLMMFFGNISHPPPVGSPECLNTSLGYNLTTTNTYVMMSDSGSVHGPWTTPKLVRGMENGDSGLNTSKDPYSWHCASGNPSPAWHPNGTLFAAMRQNTCWKSQTREHVGIWRADNGWDGEWKLVTPDPVYGWGGGSAADCSDANQCPSHEDPYLYWNERGAHLLTHDQNNNNIHSIRGAYGYSKDGLAWTLATKPMSSNRSVWPLDLKWENGSSTRLARRQRPSFILDPDTNRPTHLITGSDFLSHKAGKPKSFCDGCHWGSGFTLVQPLNLQAKDQYL